MKLALEVPINSVSFGQVATLIIRTIYEREKSGDNTIDWYILPIGGSIDLSSQRLDADFQKWLQNKLVKSVESYTRDIPVFKLWHLNGSLAAHCNKTQTLLTFYELDNPTKIEVNIAKNNKLCLSSKFSCEIFKVFGVDAHYLPLAFDSFNFSKLNKKFHDDGRIVFNLCGKLEKRKGHAKVIQSWIKKYGNNKNYALQCAIFNPFLKKEQFEQVLQQIVGPEKPYNVTFLPHMKENLAYNEFLNSGDVIIDMSGGEGFSLPTFHSLAIGKHAVVMNAHVFKDWANNDNAILVNSSGKEPAYDNMFFRQGEAYNQGNIFTFKEDDFIMGCELAIARAQQNKVNTAGLKLQEEYSKEKFLDSIIELTK